MTRDDLDAAHSAVIRRHWRDLTDADGVPTAGLLDSLAQVAADHLASEIESWNAANPSLGERVQIPAGKRKPRP